MLVFMTKRILSSVVLLFGLVTIVFIIIRIAPGDPVTMMTKPTFNGAVTEELRSQLGLDQPVLVQYGHWIRNTMSGNFGFSFRRGKPVFDVIMEIFPNTLILAIAAICVELAAGLFLGMMAVRFENSLTDKIITNLALGIYTLPAFWLGWVLLAIFSYGLGMFPSSQMSAINSDQMSSVEKIFDVARHLVLPALTLAIPGAASVVRYVRESVLEVRREDYVLFARSLGLPRKTIFLHYELRNALSPVITIVGLELGSLMAGTLVTEVIYAWPGMGRLAVQAIYARDYPLIVGCTVVAGAVVIVGNLIADLLYRVTNPRVRVSS